MKNILISILFSLILISPNFAANQDFRGIWVITWEIFREGKDGRFFSPSEIKNNIIQILDNTEKAKLNTVMWQVRQGGTSYYRSSYEPWGKHLNYQDPQFDPLSFAIKHAHQRGLRLHAWVNTFEARDSSPGTPANLHPEWICRNKENKIMPEKFTLSPGLAEVRHYLNKVILEIVQNYNIDGIHLDYIRWSEYPIDEEKNENNDFNEDYVVGQYIYDVKNQNQNGPPNNANSWDQWRRDQVSYFVQKLNILIKLNKPHVKLSAAVIGKYNWGKWNGYHSVFQDSADWYNQGYVDLIIPMAYYQHTSEKLYRLLTDNGQKSWSYWLNSNNKFLTEFVVGIGSLMLRERDLWDNHFSLLMATRKISWVDGVQFFSYGDWQKMNYFEQAARDLFNNLP